jgi:hypothetical protein
MQKIAAGWGRFLRYLSMVDLMGEENVSFTAVECSKFSPAGNFKIDLVPDLLGPAAGCSSLLTSCDHCL